MASSYLPKIVAALSLLVITAAGQQSASNQAPLPVPASYVLGPGDEITVSVLDLEEIDRKPIRIGNDGTISIPLAGRMQAAGLTVQQLERAVADRLKNQLLDPQVTVGIADFHSQPVSVVGSVNHPGVYQVQGRKSLLEMISMAEGLRTDAGGSVTITRRIEQGRIPLPGAVDDASGQFSIAKVELSKGLLDGASPEQNIAIQPHDVISVPKAELIYVIGEVHKAGGFVLNDKERLSVLQALAMAEGLNRTASAKGAKILRPKGAGAERVEIAVNLDRIMQSKEEDLLMQPNDILFIPNSASKSAALRSLETALQIGTGIVIWRR